jgi:hypothetical protein
MGQDEGSVVQISRLSSAQYVDINVSRNVCQHNHYLKSLPSKMCGAVCSKQNVQYFFINFELTFLNRKRGSQRKRSRFPILKGKI